MKPPLITIGLCVKNGEDHLADAIQSFLDQTLNDFQLLIYDNCSSDATAAIAMRFAELDPRVRHVRRDDDVGMVRSFIDAAERATTEFFCWAAHDDLRAPRFLQTLADLLRVHPEAALACSGSCNLDWDGTPRCEHGALQTLVTAADDSPRQRVLNFLRRTPCTSVYGLYRTAALQRRLDPMRELDGPRGSGLLGGDVLFLTNFLTHHAVVVAPEPLMHYRLGGFSDRPGRYCSLRVYLTKMGRFLMRLRQLALLAGESRRGRWRLRFAWAGYALRLLLGRPIRREIWHALQDTSPHLDHLHARLAGLTDRSFRRLRRRARALPGSRRIVLYGAGKHTRRCLQAIRVALGRRHTIIGICDDAAAGEASIRGIPVVKPSQVSELKPDLILVSSDTYEETLCRRAQTCKPTRTVWCIYDDGLEIAPDDPSETPGCLQTARRTDSGDSLEIT